jgi:hypothetical protein
MRRAVTSGFVALGAAFAIAAGLPSPAPAAGRCVAAEDAAVRDGDDDGAPRFRPAFYRRLLVMEVSVDGSDGAELPISIEHVCNVSRRLREQAAQLAGGDGVARLLPHTTVWRGREEVKPARVSAALDGADTASLWARLRQRRAWREDEDGDPVPTFRTERIEITD